jgi:hypothetical protein
MKKIISLIFVVLLLGAGCSQGTENKDTSVGVDFPNDFTKVKTWQTATITGTKVRFAYPPITDKNFEVKLEKNGPGLGATAAIKDSKKTLAQAQKTPDILNEFCAYPNFYITVDASAKKYTNLKDYFSSFSSDGGVSEEINQYGIYTLINSKEILIEKHESESKRFFIGHVLTSDGVAHIVMNLSSNCAYPGFVLDEKLVATPEVTEMIAQFERSNYNSFLDILKGVAYLN